MNQQMDIIWEANDGPGLEHLHLSFRGVSQSIHADGLVIGLDASGQPFRASYRIQTDGFLRTRLVRVTLLGERRAMLYLRAPFAGSWMTNAGEELPAFHGCLDVDISVTPFTNTLPIRRLNLQPGASAELAMLYVDVPALTTEAVRQRYTCLARHDTGALYRFESLPDDTLPAGFTADLPVDSEGLVLDYPGLFRRVWPRP